MYFLCLIASCGISLRKSALLGYTEKVLSAKLADKHGQTDTVEFPFCFHID